MLWFVGLGISGINSTPIYAKEIISKADMIYLEQFTSPISDTELEKIKKMSQKFKLVKRWMVEDGSEIIRSAKRCNTVLLSYGDPYVATTHIELRVRAAREGIQTDTIHASSSLTSIVGECGLHFYKIGRIATIMNDIKSLTTPYFTIYKNLINDNHTILLLEYNQNDKFFLDPRDALNYLLQTEQGQNRNVIESSTFVIVASRIGLDRQVIQCGNISSLMKINFGRPPHTIIIPSKLHFTEVDALKVLCNCVDEPHDNDIKKISTQMMEKYVPMVREALSEVKPYCTDNTIIENAELYIRDAEKFLNDGQDEVAILSIGYADGLVDALRIMNKLDPKM